MTDCKRSESFLMSPWYLKLHTVADYRSITSITSVLFWLLFPWNWVKADSPEFLNTFWETNNFLLEWWTVGVSWNKFIIPLNNISAVQQKHPFSFILIYDFVPTAHLRTILLTSEHLHHHQIWADENQRGWRTTGVFSKSYTWRMLRNSFLRLKAVGGRGSMCGLKWTTWRRNC